MATCHVIRRQRWRRHATLVHSSRQGQPWSFRLCHWLSRQQSPTADSDHVNMSDIHDSQVSLSYTVTLLLCYNRLFCLDTFWPSAFRHFSSLYENRKWRLGMIGNELRLLRANLSFVLITLLRGSALLLCQPQREVMWRIWREADINIGPLGAGFEISILSVSEQISLT